MAFNFFRTAAALLCCLAGTPLVAAAQQPGAKPATPPTSVGMGQLPSSFFGTYTYRSYTVHSAGEEPVQANGVGGTLKLFPTGLFEKRLQLTGPNGPVTFSQRGRFTVSGPNISFAYLDSQQTPKADNGTFRYDAKKQTLELTINGFPAGSKAVYVLQAAGPLR
ncbi:hypothetical protein D3Y59_07115 [Hymenobacter oligotrophus]|uniref:Lipocalin-like domain-containing protein n=1 Tax=Hymenobacter oligotrophus TaxID=2319843 RepID=A0A3B7RBI7_9BACT|nr:hypothetical protein [Hymenobacter oligotrophus]AYA36846.1 hypothetical protein D3Y59_07115 [Hymenobacter oligotrophus]